MGSDLGRMATGISYLVDTAQVQESEYASEVDSRRRATKGLGLSQTLMLVGRQHHQQQDPNEAIKCYLRALELVEEGIEFREKHIKGPKKALEYLRFTLSEVCSSLGVAFNDVGRTEEALSMHQRALEVRKQTVG